MFRDMCKILKILKLLFVDVLLVFFCFVWKTVGTCEIARYVSKVKTSSKTLEICKKKYCICNSKIKIIKKKYCTKFLERKKQAQQSSLWCCMIPYIRQSHTIKSWFDFFQLIQMNYVSKSKKKIRKKSTDKFKVSQNVKQWFFKRAHQNRKYT